MDDIGYQTFPIDFWNYILSDPGLRGSYPFLKPCYISLILGVLSVRVRVRALTTSVYNIHVVAEILITKSADITTSAVSVGRPWAPWASWANPGLPGRRSCPSDSLGLLGQPFESLGALKAQGFTHTALGSLLSLLSFYGALRISYNEIKLYNNYLINDLTND